MKLCEPDRFLNQTELTKDINIEKSYYCPPRDFNVNISGALSYEFTQTASIRVDFCTE